MPDENNPVSSQPAAQRASDDVPLSEHAEDVLANAIGRSVELDSASADPPVKTVQQVLTELIGNKEELVITLDYGAGESGVDQASWDIEMTSLQRAYLRKKRADKIDQLSNQLLGAIKTVKAAFDDDWAEKTRELGNMTKIFDRQDVTRQQVDDLQHRIFGRDAYFNYLDAVLSSRDEKRLFNAASNLRQVAQQLEVDYEALIDPSNIDNNELADEIISRDGDISALSRELERNYTAAVFRRNLASIEAINYALSEDFLKQYKLWAHSFDLNLREVLATQQSAINGQISEKAQTQLREMLQAGAEQIHAVNAVIG